MKLRVAELRDGTFMIQRRTFLFWWVMATHITDGVYDSRNRALEDAKYDLAKHRRKKKDSDIVNTWEVG